MFRLDSVLSFDYPRSEVALVGWCSLENHIPPDTLWTEYDGVRVPCLNCMSRPDVARHYNVPSLSTSGFLCRFPVDRAKTDVTLIGERGSEEHVIARFVARWQKPAVSTAPPHDYAGWLQTCEPALYWPPKDVTARLGVLALTPLISVIVPTYNTQLYHLHRCIESVVGQWYPHWQLCLSDDASSDPRVRAYLSERAANDSRIRVTFSSRQGGISAASNHALALATGEFVVLLDHDDELNPSALLEVARCLNAYPSADLIYSDEDKIDQVGSRTYPAFKPEFDHDLLCAFNYLGHLVAIRLSLVKQVGGFRSDSDGAQDWDLLLRVTSQSDGARIRHIPKPLYHWRMHEESTAFSLDAKPYAVRAWRRVLERHLEPAASCRVTDGLFLGSMRVIRPLPDGVRIAIVCRGRDGTFQRRALARSKIPRQTTFFEVVFCSIHRADAPGGEALLTVDDLQSDVTIVLNCGIESVNHHFIEEIAAQAYRDDCGVVAATVLRGDGTVLTAGLACLSDGTYVNPFEGLTLPEVGYMGQARVVRRVAAIGPQAFAFRTSRLLDVSGLVRVTEDSLDGLCDALVRHAHAAGLAVLHTPYAIVTLRNSVTAYRPCQGASPPPDLVINRNLERFPSVSTVLRTGIH